MNIKEIKEFLGSEGKKRIYTVVDVPISNDRNEWLKQTPVNKIRCLINENHRKITWTTIARNCVKIHNENEYIVTKDAPIYLLEGENVNIAADELKTKEEEERIEIVLSK